MEDAGSLQTVIVIPTFNEAENLEGVVGRVLDAEPDVDVLVVDDDSPDGTGEIADQLAASDSRVRVLHRTAKTGLGDAYLEGFALALERGYDVIGQMDADGSHRPEQLGRLRATIADADVVIGSRWVAEGSIENWPRSRELLSRVGNRYVRVALGIDVRDVTAGYRLYRADVLRAIELATVSSHGYCFQTDLTRLALRAGFSVVEVPIDFVERTAGVSKMSRAIVVETLVKVTGWAIADRTRGSATRLDRRRTSR